MSHVIWQDSYKLNVHEIDTQHEEMAGLVEGLYEAVAAKVSLEEVNRILSDLIECTREHFVTEERLMLEHGYPNYQQHKEEHDELLEQLEFFGLEAMRRTYFVYRFDFDVSRDWFLKHIEDSDKALASFLNDKGIY
jgi:hemerythrin